MPRFDAVGAAKLQGSLQRERNFHAHGFDGIKDLHLQCQTI